MTKLQLSQCCQRRVTQNAAGVILDRTREGNPASHSEKWRELPGWLLCLVTSAVPQDLCSAQPQWEAVSRQMSSRWGSGVRGGTADYNRVCFKPRTKQSPKMQEMLGAQETRQQHQHHQKGRGKREHGGAGGGTDEQRIMWPKEPFSLQQHLPSVLSFSPSCRVPAHLTICTLSVLWGDSTYYRVPDRWEQLVPLKRQSWTSGQARSLVEQWWVWESSSSKSEAGETNILRNGYPWAPSLPTAHMAQWASQQHPPPTVYNMPSSP
jgi:hypothetical protein